VGGPLEPALTLFNTPVVYLLLDRFSQRRGPGSGTLPASPDGVIRGVWLELFAAVGLLPTPGSGRVPGA
jgi:hypothetical protein